MIFDQLLTPCLLLSLSISSRHLMSHVILDTDVGIDDFFAIEVLKKKLSESGRSLEAVTLVHGNIALSKAAETARLLVPENLIFRGAEKPIVKNIKETPCWPGHGLDGCGDAFEFVKSHLMENNLLPEELSDSNFKKKHCAAIEIVRLCELYSGEVTILAIGPLTNVALAILLDRNLKAKIIIMGGSLFGKGISFPLVSEIKN